MTGALGSDLLHPKSRDDESWKGRDREVGRIREGELQPPEPLQESLPGEGRREAGGLWLGCRRGAKQWSVACWVEE